MSTTAPTQPHDGRKWIGLPVAFDHEGKRLVGTVTDVRWTGYTVRGAIPDWELTVRGKSGAVLKVSVVEQHAKFNE